MAWFYNLFNRDPASNAALVSHAGVGPGATVLDVGCGPGAALEHAFEAGARVFGVDPTPGMVKRASDRVPEASVVLGSAEHLDFDDDSFDVVWSLSAFHHWAYPDTAIGEVFRVLKEGGRVLIAERRLKDGKTGHGIDAAGADEVASQLIAKGFEDTTVDTMKAKRKDYLVVTGVK